MVEFMTWFKKLKGATRQTKFFFFVVVAVFLINLVFCLYPYIWMSLHKSGAGPTLPKWISE